MRGAKIGVSKICDTSCRLHIEAKGQWRQDGFIDLFCYGIGNCSYSSGTPARIALAILEVQSAGFALFYDLLYKLRVNGTKMRCGRRECKGFRRGSAR